jgi:phospholipid/cholesterol/gamma-HCH transport system substrate-binding protein
LGVLVITSAVLLTWGYFWLTGQPLGERGFTVVVLLPDAAGLERGDRVQVSGVEVGVVRSVALAGPGKVAVRLWLQKSLRLPRDSRALLQSVGVFGDQIVLLQPGTAAELAADGDTLAAGTVESLLDLADDLGDQAQAALSQLNQLLADSTIEQVHGSVAALPGTIRGLETLARDGGAEFEALSRSLRETAETLRGALGDANVEQLIADLEHTAAKLSQTADSFQSSAESLASIAAKIDRGEGSLGLLVNDPGLYQDLRSAIRSADALAQDLRENPGRYLNISVF